MASPGQSSDATFLAFQTTLAGRYSIDREVGRGGMGIVYLAREVHLDRPVAIKLLPPDRAADPTLRERFLREVRLAAKLSHPNIIPIHAVEDSGGFVFYVMSFIDGETLANRVRTRGPVSGTEGARILREVAWALSYAHDQGVVHRDVKPDNILLERSTGRVLVADFGIAAALGQVSADGVSGTPEFMSPEQVLGGHIDGRSDIYGLGATAFYAFSGRFPIEGTTATEILARQVTEPAPPLSSLGLPVSRKLAAIVDRCLAKDPAQRPATAMALAEMLGVAMEQRRELPAALRTFVKRNCRLNGGGTLITSFVAIPAAGSVAAMTESSLAGVLTLGAIGIGAPLSYFIWTARRLMMLGFTHQDLSPAFKAEAEQASEELAVEQSEFLARLRRWMPRVAKGSLLVFLTLVLAELLRDGPAGRAIVDFLSAPPFSMRWLLRNLTGFTLTAFVSTMVATVSSIALIQQRRDIDTEFWGRIWLGRAGRAIFSVAGKFLGKRVPQSAMTHRATELSLGLAAEQLYESLPRDSRLALGNLPEVLRRLQEDAQSMRKRYDGLQEALASAPATEEYAELRATRDLMHGKLTEAVGSLETIRLNLLRLHAGSATVESLTTHLGMAEEVSRDVERLIAAHHDVERAMRFPRIAAVTP